MDELINKEKLLYADLSYKIIGLIYETFNELGPGLQEKYYQKALAICFRKNKIKFQEQLATPLNFNNEKIGSFYLDFLIEDKIILELKRGDYFRKSNISQIYQYLVATKLSLGLLANFTNSGVKIKRIVNIY